LINDRVLLRCSGSADNGAERYDGTV